MLSQTIVLDGESRDLFEQLLTSLIAEVQPRTPIEAALVETMATARWRQMRTWAIQKAGFDLEMSRPENSSGARPARFALVFRSLSDNSRVLDLIHRYETAFDRQFSRALSLILKLRAGSPSQTEAPADFPALTAATLTWEADPPVTNTDFPNEPSGAEPPVA